MTFTKTMRAWHRDLGYLFIGITIIYAVSGILILLKKDGQNPSYREIVTEKKVKTDLSPDDLKAYWQSNFTDLPELKRVIPVDETYKIYVKGGLGEYEPYSGKVIVKTFKKILVFKFVNDIHYNSGNRFTIMGVVYALVLIFFAISGAIMAKGKKGFMKRGVWFMIVGLIIPVLLFLFA